MRHAALVILCALAAATPARAEGRFQVEPTRVDLSSTAPSGAITVSNRGGGVLRLQATVYRWAQDADGGTQLTPAPEMVVRPALFEVQPGKARTVRVGTTATPAGVEQSYRVFVEELPDRTTAQTAGIHVLTRVGVPVFLAPREARVAIELLPATSNGKVAVVVKNPGTLHVKLAEVRLRAADGAWQRSVAGWYVLPGDSRRFAVEPAQPCSVGGRWVAEATSEDGGKWTSPPSPCEK